MNKKSNRFSRIIIVLLIAFIAAIVIISFVWGSSKFSLTNEIITLILVLVVLALSEVFDNFSIANLITVQKEKKEKENEINKVSAENKELRAQLTTIISNSITNRNMNIFGFSKDDLVQVAGVEQAESEDVEEKKEEEFSAASKSSKDDFALRRKMRPEIENLVLNYFCREKKISALSIVKEVKFSNEFIGIDPIMDRNIIFDAYYKSIQEEFFIEIKIELSSMFFYNLYYYLSKVLYYRKANQLQAKVILLLPILPESYWQGRIYRGKERMIRSVQETFAPAIKNNLLEIIPVEVSEEEEELDAIRKGIADE